MISDDAQINSYVDRESLFMLVIVVVGFVLVLHLPCFLELQDVSGSFCPFLTTDLGFHNFPTTPGFF